MRFRIWLLPAAVAASVVTACVSTNAALLDPSVKLAVTCPNAVQMFTTPDKVTSQYHEVALLNSSGSTMWTSEGGMMRSQRTKAAQLGANGIILGGIDEPGAMAKVLGGFLGTGNSRKGKAVAIHIPADSARVRTVCSTNPGGE